MRTLRLHGRLAKKFGKQFEFEAANVREAISAMCANFPTFHAEIVKGHYEVVAGPRKGGLRLGEENLTLNLAPGQQIHVIPRIAGAKRGGIGKLVAGVALVAVGIASGGGAVPLFGGALGGGFTWGTVAMVGAAMAFAGIAQLLTPTPKSPAARERQEDRPSFLLGGAVNVEEQGHPIPLMGGENVVGGIVISAGITVERIPA